MSREEFDNRLKSSFQDEYLPPSDKLWVNISENLGKKNKNPMWHWLLPALIIATTGIVWLGISLSNEDEKLSVNTNHEEIISNNGPSVNIEADKSIIGEKDINNTESTIKDPEKSPLNKRKNTPHKTVVSNPENNKTQDPIKPRKNPFEKFLANRFSQVQERNIANQDLSDPSSDLTFLRIVLPPKFSYPLTNELFESALFSKKDEPKSPDKTKNAPTSDFTSKRWFSFGIGPQLSINKVIAYKDSIDWIHHHLWDNRAKMTGNGTGLQAFANFSYKFGKNNKFLFETGLHYGIRTESIHLNEESYDIAARGSDGKILQYAHILLEVRYYDSMNGKWDTTYYNAVSSFTMAVVNKYQTFTIPVNFGSEFKITENTFISLTAGGGISLIRSGKTEHIEMIYGRSKKQSSSTMISSSLNAKLAMYTNFNDIGQIGLYLGYQFYLNPWKVNPGQYSIGMRDAQMGITFLKPF